MRILSFLIGFQKVKNIKVFFDENFKGLHIKKYNIFSSIKETFIRFKTQYTIKISTKKYS